MSRQSALKKLPHIEIIEVTIYRNNLTSRQKNFFFLATTRKAEKVKEMIKSLIIS